MSLQVWSPLNKDKPLRNQGFSPCLFSVPSDGTAVLTNTGKLGKSWLFDGNTSYIQVGLKKLFNYTNWTYCCWIYNDDGAGRSVLLGNYGLTGASSINIEKTAAEKIRFYWNGSPDLTFANTTLPVGAWTHLAITYDGTKIITYINGVVADTQTQTLSNLTNDAYYYLGRDNRTGATAFKGQMNDFRFYDEALTADEIYDIAKGLVAHYKLDEPVGWSNAASSATYDAYNNYTSVGATATVQTLDETFLGQPVKRLTWTPTADCLEHVQTSLWGHGIRLSNSSNAKFTFSANTKYCFTIFCRPVSNSDTIIGGTASNINGWTEIPMSKYNDDWYICGQTRDGSVTSSKTDNIFVSFMTPSAVADTPITMDFVFPNLQVGYDEIIPFQFVPNKIYDYSGNSYNGTIGGTPKHSVDSPKNNGCLTFNGTTDYIALQRPMPKDELTVNAWAFMNDWTTFDGRIISCTETGGWNFEKQSDGLGAGLGVDISGSNVYTNNLGGSLAPLSELTSGWHMFTLTFDGIYKKVYIDGVLKGSTNKLQNGTTLTTKTPIHYNSNNGVFIGAEAGANTTTPAGNYFNGKIGDTRIYGTALSEKDILNLYHTSTVINNKQSLYSAEINEINENNFQIEPNGEVYSKNITENPILPSGYQALSYIQSSGTQYIDTNFKPNPKTRVVMNFYIVSRALQDRFFGVHATDGLFYETYVNGSGYVAFAYQDDSGNWISTGKSATAGRTFTIDFDGNIKHYSLTGSATYSGTLGAYTATKTSDYNLFLFGLNNNGVLDTTNTPCKIRLYSCKIYNNGGLIRDYIPVLDNNNVACLYDRHNGITYYNAGTGTFTAGSIIKNGIYKDKIIMNNFIEN